jgi:hypothetical protein
MQRAALRASHRAAIVTAIVTAGATLGVVVALAGCSSGGSKSSSATIPPAIATAPTTVTSSETSVASGGANDPCKLLSRDDVKAAIGAPAEGKAMTTAVAKDGDPMRIGCTWGELAGEGGVIGVQISSKNGSPIDPLQVLIESVETVQKGTPIDIGTDGKLLSKALIPFGGGEGQSVAFKHGDQTVVVGLVRGEQAKFEAAARTVAANLG